MAVLYGIGNCDSVRKARRWLRGHEIEYAFHDFRKDGPEEDQLRRWVAELGSEKLLNRRGTTWRRLPEADRASMDKTQAVRIMLEHPATIKRPLLDLGDRRVPGFSEAQHQGILSHV